MTVKYELLKNAYRHDVLRLLKHKKCIGIELGVAGGVFSKRMVNSGNFEHFFGVDMYADMHDTNEYKKALLNVGLMEQYKLLRMTFEEALDLFEDNYFDFIYIDGYAHSGEEGGKTIIDWSKKVKIGGVIAGDDYHENWPLVVEAVAHFIKQTNYKLYITEYTEDGPTSEFPSWAVVKTHDAELEISDELYKKGQIANKKHLQNYYLKNYLLNLLPISVYKILKKAKQLLLRN